MLYIQPYSWGALLKEDMAVAILRGWRAEGKAEAAVECSVGEKLGFAPITTSLSVFPFHIVPVCVSIDDGPKRPVLDPF